VGAIGGSWLQGLCVPGRQPAVRRLAPTGHSPVGPRLQGGKRAAVARWSRSTRGESRERRSFPGLTQLSCHLFAFVRVQVRIALQAQ
jgi:hypothetical protein